MNNNPKRELLEKWVVSASIMHVAHHVAAARYAFWHRAIGGFTAALTALVSAAAFTALQKRPETVWLVSTGLLSIAAAVVTATNTFLGFETRAERHYQAAVLFQGLRRQIEEELAFFADRNNVTNYENLRQRWTKALEASVPLPPRIYKKVRKEPLDENPLLVKADINT